MDVNAPPGEGPWPMVMMFHSGGGVYGARRPLRPTRGWPRRRVVEGGTASTTQRGADDAGVDNKTLVEVNAVIRYHPVEEIGEFLRAAMNGMKAL